MAKKHARGAYWYHMFTCPFYSSNEKLQINCENHCRVRFYAGKDAKRYIESFCASNGGWEHCSIALMLGQHYEEDT